LPKQAGLGDYIAVDDSSGTVRDISNDVTNLSVNTSQGLIDVTGLDKSAMERIIGLGDGSFQLNGVFNPDANKSHDVFSPLSGVRTVTYAIGGNTSGKPKLEMECLVASYNVSRGNDVALTWTADLQLANGAVPTWGTVA
jgi:hypothetical protein